ncbi:MAG TPA: hypothetical protein VFX98_18120 [Longimicrobiaceae bacterium]|nr:hypothetical protein [Longimicrobiaceae bacterium]
MAGPAAARAAEDRREHDARAARELRVQRFVQPDDETCGPTCLRKVYAFYGLQVETDAVVRALEPNEGGGTLAVFLGVEALKRGFCARIYSYDLRIFDPTWFRLPAEALAEKIHDRFPYLMDAKRLAAARAYRDFLCRGGELAFDELTPGLFRRIIDRGHPVLAGLSATYLYRMPRERHDEETDLLVDDDVRGEPTGHFVVISGYAQWGRRLVVLDPSEHVPVPDQDRHVVDAQTLINAILLGDVTYDAVLLEVWPADQDAGEAPG